MSHPIHHALEIGATSEKPRRVRVLKIMYPNAEVDARRLDSRQPHSGAEGVARDRSTHLGEDRADVRTSIQLSRSSDPKHVTITP